MKQSPGEGSPNGRAGSVHAQPDVEGDDDQLVSRDVLAGVHKAMCASGATMIPGTLTIPAVYWWSANRTGMIIGMAIALAVSLPVMLYLRGLDMKTHPNPIRALAIANAVPNGIWAPLPIWMMPADQTDLQCLLIALPLAMLVTNLAATATVREVYIAGQIPLAVGAVVAFAVFADGNARWAGAIIAVTVVVLDGLGRSLSETAHRSAQLQRRNTRLVASLEATNEVLEHGIRHDHLTGLANRRALTEFLEDDGEGGSGASRSQGDIAVLLLDLDGFKAVNDRYGHHYGDELLVLVADRLGSLVSQRALVGRRSGDEFAVVWKSAPSLRTLTVIAARINDQLRSPFLVEDTSIHISASIGVAVGHRSAPSAALRRADDALYRAKAAGRDRAELPDPSSDGRPSDGSDGLWTREPGSAQGLAIEDGSVQLVGLEDDPRRVGPG